MEYDLPTFVPFATGGIEEASLERQPNWALGSMTRYPSFFSNVFSWKKDRVIKGVGEV